MQSKASIKVFFLLQSCVVQHSLAVNKAGGAYNAYSKGSVVTRTLIRSPLLYEHGALHTKAFIHVFKGKRIKASKKHLAQVLIFDTGKFPSCFLTRESGYSPCSVHHSRLQNLGTANVFHPGVIQAHFIFPFHRQN